MPTRIYSHASAADLHASGPFDRERDATMDDERLERLIDRLPRFLRSSIRWLRKPPMIWLRIPAGFLLIMGGPLSFLPILGLWMLPLGLMIIAEDLPFLQSPLVRIFQWTERKWKAWRSSPR